MEDEPRSFGVFLCPCGDVYAGYWARPAQDEATSSADGSASASSRSARGRHLRRWPGERGGTRDAMVAPWSPSSSPHASSRSPCGGSSPPVPPQAAGAGPRPCAAPRHAAAAGPLVVHGSAPRREGWGVYLRGHEKYEGEWKSDRRHGLGCEGGRFAERYVGRFANGQRATGLALSKDGAVCIEAWHAGQLASKRPIFSASEDVSSASSRSSSPSSCPGRCSGSTCTSRSPSRSSTIVSVSGAAAERYAQAGGTARCAGTVGPATAATTKRQAPAPATVERSTLQMMEEWSPREVARIVRHLGLGASAAAKLRAHHADGRVLGTLASRVAVPFLREVFGEVAGEVCQTPDPRRKLLVLAVELFLRLRRKLRHPPVTGEFVRQQFPDLEIGEGQLTFGEMVGEGGYAHVHQARWMHVDVAAKAFRVVDTGLPPRSFYSELCTLKGLRHPNITSLLGFCLKPKFIIVTEFVCGGSLFDLLHRTRHPPGWNLQKVLCVSRELCSGMAYLHTKGIVHCDLKSSNVLLNWPGEAKICDFGLAQFLSDKETAPEEGETGISLGCVGTHHWMAPEVLRGERYSKAADVYSFGMVLWEMLSRKVPFQGYTAVQVIGLVGYGQRRPQLPRACPRPLGELVQRALRRKPRSRSSFQALAEQLRRLHRTAVVDVEARLRAFLFG